MSVNTSNKDAFTEKHVLEEIDCYFQYLICNTVSRFPLVVLKSVSDKGFKFFLSSCVQRIDEDWKTEAWKFDVSSLPRPCTQLVIFCYILCYNKLPIYRVNLRYAMIKFFFVRVYLTSMWHNEDDVRRGRSRSGQPLYYSVLDQCIACDGILG